MGHRRLIPAVLRFYRRQTRTERLYEKCSLLYEGENHLAADKFDVSALTFSAFFTGVCYGDSYELDYEGNAVVFHVDNGTEGEELIRFELPADKD